MQNPFRYFNSSPEVIRLAVMMHVRCPLSLRQIEHLLVERSIRRRGLINGDRERQDQRTHDRRAEAPVRHRR